MADFVDVSGYQPQTDWRAYRAAGHTLAVIKASEGTGYTFSRFAANVRAAHAAGVTPYAYHFLHGSGEAQHFLAVCAPVMNLLGGLVLDFEATATAAAAVNFQVDVERVRTGKHLVIYAGPYKIPESRLGHRAGWDWWAAAYTSRQPRPPAGWPQPWAWQYTDRARVAGCPAPLDCSHLLGAIPAPAPNVPPAPIAAVLEDDVNYLLVPPGVAPLKVVAGLPFLAHGSAVQVLASMAALGTYRVSRDPDLYRAALASGRDRGNVA